MTDREIDQAVVEAFGLREEIVMDDGGSPTVRANTPGFEMTDGSAFWTEGPLTGREITDEHLKTLGWVKKRRWVSDWQVIE